MKILLVVVGILVFFPELVFCQNVRKTRLIRIPSESGVVSVMSQPECPLRISKTELFTKEDGQYPIIRYVIQNTSPKPIRYFSVAFATKFTISKWHRFGSGLKDEIGREDGKGPNLLKKGDRYSNWPELEFETVPLNDIVQEILRTKPDERGLKFVGIGLVTKAIFADGSGCDVDQTYDGLYDLLHLEG
ncbi:MAG TPA: hypothetical protein VMS29_05260 [Pyrinomonadaceae bacterium]|nr:hypothetical protein [Pyrinomonadaceae bacterium]